MAITASSGSPLAGVAQPPGAALATANGHVRSCSECGAALAGDQRYCVECGARCTPLPSSIAERIAAAGAPNGALPESSAAAAAGSGGPRPKSGGLPQLSSPAIGLAVAALLLFGVGVGAVVTPAEGTEDERPVIVALRPPAKSAPPTSAPATPPSESAASSPEAPSTPASPATSTASTPPSTAASNPSHGGKPKSGGGSPPPAAGALPPIKHVFLIALSDQSVGAAFSASSPAPYLSKTLAAEGELLRDYYAVSTGELANMLALISGQGPTPQTVANCSIFAEVTPGTAGAEGQVLGSGCVYPRQTITLADQLTSAGKTWRAYVGGLENPPPGQPTSCRHPALGAADSEQAPSPGHPYVTWRNPFVYFQSLISSPACAQDDVPIEQLGPDLASAAKTPSLAFIVPDRCQDGSPEPCAPGQPAGLAPAGALLEKIVPEIELSPAYKEGGLIAITFDRAPQTGPEADSSSCCITATYPNIPSAPAASGTTGAGSGTTGAAGTGAAQTGGGKVGLLLISKYVKPGSVAVGEYNHFALLLSIEKLFELRPLGYAGTPGLLPFDNSVFNAYR
jgi:hypothetical protein